ncbi:nuclear pore glycoprotein p62-like [Amblyraja radiata]|uniref:nuclear pore glycoprotein p62-like n=1 Tax=Amblyraja radiata TaxID=386614 RepID=UPI001402F83B|nr:nuclear pore glycoprotein p62-like [Amblyraja radiata]XP_032886770.1 nuclear pore glycoprotein p62-like [Amblyraja radiata]XP_032886772.1 nuclear pore glycoprotein p62-like [Amblyraja radiata]XP_032886773.1 nuclear pore glycoprotein p62-like [Amblyraja radiata]
MSFNFGNPAAGGGFSFASQKTATGGTGGFSFGNNAGAPQGGFGFGTAQQPAAAAPATTSAPNANMFSFTTPTATTGFGLPVQPAATSTAGCFPVQPAATSTAGGFPVQPAATSTAGGFPVQPAATSTAGGFPLAMNKGSLGGFGSAAAPPAAGFSFGSMQATSATAPATSACTATTAGFSLPSGTTAQTVAPSGFSFGAVPAQPVPGGFGLGAVSTVQTTATTGFGFTAAPAAPAAPTQTTAAGGFGFTTCTTQPLSGFSFGTPACTTAPPKPAAPISLGAPATGFAFGAPTTVSSAPTAALASQSFSFGAKPAGLTTGAASVAPAAGSSLFASVVSSDPSTSSLTTGFPLTTCTSSVPAASTSAPFGFKPTGAALPVTTATTLAPTTSAIAATTSTGFSLGLKTPVSFSMTPGPTGAAANVSTAATVPTTAVCTTAATSAIISSAATTISASPVMSYAQLEGLINKWSVELEDQEKQFLHQATQVNAWDRMLIENGEKITALHREAEKVKLDQKRLDQELDFILSQQKELEDLLAPLEESVRDHHGTIYLQHADEEREHTYKLAENIDAQLKRMAQDLKEIIQHLNTSNSSSEINDPLQQICKILNAHMDSLQWIDQSSVLLQKKVEDVSKQFEVRRKEQERNYRITFD